MTLTRTALVAAFFAATIACTKSDTERAGQTTTTKATTTSNAAGVQVDPARYQQATARIAGARCDRQVTCEQVGNNKRFETREICARDEARRTQDELRSADCPGGIDDTKLQTCLSALSKQDCSSLVSSLQSVEACKTAALCMAP